MFSPGEEYTTRAAVDLSQKKYFAAKLDANGDAVLAAAATDNIVGVIHDGGRKAGDSCSIMNINGSGTFKVIAGGTIAKDAFITSDATGQAVAATQAAAGAQPTTRVFGQAVRAAVVGDIVEYRKKDLLI